MEDDAKSDERAEEVDVRPKDDTSPNISDSSDLVTGTPQKPNSRRQSFITLEKYVEGKPASSGSTSPFTGLLVKTSNSQERSNVKNKTTPTGPDSHNSPQSRETDALESPRRPKDSRTKSEPVKLTERLPSESTEDEDIIPDTQPEAESKDASHMASSLEEVKSSSQEEESEPAMDNSQAQTSPTEPRRSGRPRIRPLLPGEDPDEREAKYTPLKRRRSGEEPANESNSAPSRPKTRSKQAAEDNAGRDRLRSRAQRDSSQTSSVTRPRKKIKLYSNSEELLDVNKPEKKRRSTSGQESDQDSQTQRRRSRQSKASQDVDKEESSQTVTQELVEQSETNKETKEDSQTVVVSPQTGDDSQEIELLEQDADEPNKDSQILESSSQVDAQSQESEPEEEKSKKGNADSQIVPSSSPAAHEKKTSLTDKLVDEELVKDVEHKTTESVDANLSQEDSQVSTPSPSSSESKRKSRRSKTSAESETKSENTDSLRRQSRSNSQPEVQTGGRMTRRSKVHEGVSTPESSQSLEMSGSESSQGRGRYSTRRSSQGLVPGVESSESESSDARENPPIVKKRGRKPRASLQSPLTVESKEDRTDVEKVDADSSQQLDTQTVETDLEEASKTQDLQSSDLVPGTDEVETKDESAMEVDAIKETEDTSSQSLEMLKSVEVSHEQIQEESLVSAVNTAPPDVKMENLQVPESSEEKVEEEVSEPRDKVDVDSDQEHSPVPEGGAENQNVSEELPKEEEMANQQTEAMDLQEEEVEDKDVKGQESKSGHEPADEVVTNLDAALAEVDEAAVPQESPVKQKDLEALMEADIAQSPSGGRTRGTWSPSASPSTSILKKGQKRPLEVVETQTPSPLVKVSHHHRMKFFKNNYCTLFVLYNFIFSGLILQSRRVSFANPIQQQELADDIDRRSPALRTSSPRRSKISGIPQPKVQRRPGGRCHV